MKRRSRVIWNLNRNCNFNCSYCYVGLRIGKPGRGPDVDIPAFKNVKTDYRNIMLCGGEPFIYPDFVELCKRFNEFTNISITTNCSTKNVYDFADKINPKKVDLIHISMHIGERKKKDYDELINKIRYLKERKFKCFLTQVIHPKLIYDYMKTYSYFNNRGIKIIPKPMKGVYHLKEYPNAYNEFQRRIILLYSEHSVDQHVDYPEMALDPMIYGRVDWYGIPCLAGTSGFMVRYSGDVYRCYGVNDKLGNIYEGNVKLYDEIKDCPSKRCVCEPEGRRYHSIDGYIHIHQNPIYIARRYAETILYKMGWKN